MANDAPVVLHGARVSKPAGSPREMAENTGDDWDAEQDNDIAPLTRAEAEQLFGPNVSRPSRVTPAKVVAAQVALTLCSTLAWWLFSSRPGMSALSAALGGAVCWVPGMIFVWRLRRMGQRQSIATWVVGEAIKIAVTVTMFIVIVVVFPGVRWVPLLVTYVLALKTFWVALAWR
jgi:ATP synthase protein I